MSSISAGTTTGSALVSTGDTTGDLVLKTGSGATTAVTISGSTQVITLAAALPVGSGGTGQTTYTNGQLLIGNTTGNTLTKASLTAGSNITITPGAGSITIAASGGVSTDVGNLGVGMFAVGASLSATVAAGATTGSFRIFSSVNFGTPANQYTSVAGTWRNISGYEVQDGNSNGLGSFQRIS